MLKTSLVALSLLWGSTALAQTPCLEGSVCVSPEDMTTVVQLLKDKQCQQTTSPVFILDSINIVVDQSGRIYHSGDEPHPYSLKMNWCNYEVVAKGSVKLVVAKKEPPTWGFRVRPKFAGTFLFWDAFYQDSASEAVDVGLLWEFLFWEEFNVNLATGFRSIGAGLGLDLSKNMTLYGGYAFSWWTLKHNPSVGIGFSFF